MSHDLLLNDTVPPLHETSQLDIDREADDKSESSQRNTPKRKRGARSDEAKAKRTTDAERAKRTTDAERAKRTTDAERAKRTTDAERAKRTTTAAHAKRSEDEAKPSPQRNKRLLRHAEQMSKARKKHKAPVVEGEEEAQGPGGPELDVF